MRGLRRHLLPFIALVLAVSAGVVWGMGPLTEQVQSTVETQTRELNAEHEARQARIEELEQKARVHERFVRAVSGPLATRQLHDRSVVMFVAPGAEAGLVERTAKALRAAGAGVTNTIVLTDDYVDPTKAVSPLEDVALRLVPPGVTFPSGASPIDRVSTVLARSTVTSAAGEAGRLDDKGAEVLAGLEEIGALKVEGGHAGMRSELAVLVVGSAATAPGGDRRASAFTETLVGLARALDRASRGLVVVGPQASAGRDGVIGALRQAPSRDDAAAAVSTVDMGDTSMGPVAVVLALAQNLQGQSGHYGAGAGAKTFLPPLRPAPRP